MTCGKKQKRFGWARQRSTACARALYLAPVFPSTPIQNVVSNVLYGGVGVRMYRRVLVASVSTLRPTRPYSIPTHGARASFNQGKLADVLPNAGGFYMENVYAIGNVLLILGPEIPELSTIRRNAIML